MRTGPKFKIARRLGAPIFEKTQTQKYALSLSRKERSGKMPTRAKSEFGQQLIEKQKARFSYGLTEKQFRKYVDKALRAPEPAQKLFEHLETRLDNVLYRAGFGKTRAAARQMASHGHVTVNGKRVTVPSIALSEGDVVGIRESSGASPLFADLDERLKVLAPAPWLKVDAKARKVEVAGTPVYAPAEHVFDLRAVMEFYNR